MNRNMLRGKIAENGLRTGDLARELHVSRTTFYRKMKLGQFTIGEANKLCELLHIDDPVIKCEIFLP